MRYEGKSEQDAVDQAARALKKAAGELRYRVLRDEKSFWGGRVVEIEVEGGVGSRESGVQSPESGVESPTQDEPREAREPAPAGATDAEAASLVEATLTELLSAAGLLLEIRRRESSGDELQEQPGRREELREGRLD